MKLWHFIFVAVLPLVTGCQKYKFLSMGTSVDFELVPLNSTPIVVVMGQSNALGLGQYSPSTLSPGILWRGLDQPRGIGVSFAETLQRQYGYSYVVVVQCSVGSTSISQWQPGGALFSDCINVINHTKQNIPGAQVAALLFWQGERDACDLNTASAWESGFIGFARGFRAAIGRPKLPIVFAHLNHAGSVSASYPYWNEVKAQQMNVSLEFCEIVRTDDINDLADSNHVGANGLYQIGRRMFFAYRDIGEGYR